jgi:hypothetical protein
MGMTRDSMAPRCDSSPFPTYKCQKRKRRWDVTPEDVEKEKEQLLRRKEWRKIVAAETVRNKFETYKCVCELEIAHYKMYIHIPCLINFRISFILKCLLLF